jgi:hypothetical protein
VLSTIATVFTTAFPCRRISAVFATPEEFASQCSNPITTFIGFSPLNILTDLLILFLPIPVIVKQLRLPRRQKFVLYLTLAFSGCLVLLDIARIVLLQRADALLERKMDFTYHGAPSFVVSVVSSKATVNLYTAIKLIRYRRT